MRYRIPGLVFLCKAKGILIYNYVASIIIFGYCTEDPADCAGSSALSSDYDFKPTADAVPSNKKETLTLCSC